MHHIASENRRVLRNDKLVLIVTDTSTGKVYRQGKRVAKDCLLTHEEIRPYVKTSSSACVKLIMANRNMKLAPAYNLLKAARGDL